MVPLFAEASFSLPDNFWVGLVGSFVFGLLGLLLLVGGFKVFEWITPKLDVEDQLQKGNMAVAVVVAALLLALAYIVSHVVH